MKSCDSSLKELSPVCLIEGGYFTKTIFLSTEVALKVLTLLSGPDPFSKAAIKLSPPRPPPLLVDMEASIFFDWESKFVEVWFAGAMKDSSYRSESGEFDFWSTF